ncbi:MAG: LL-diaminopimelate aminotransferase [Nitrospira sp. SB0677_bin_15]|nr:LL-diaminopimelate aminotransferase [Nitrospira sp. SB0667_bin_9]MYD30105.1 LL-diaminopimelate aminotransferase [Nitrospira sp. SB0661_bin_20]MYG39985.1 LL-diaminopimelate aminotransferase [Nitrospira sp. SB0677_bin_15]MYH02682.1 LL-diaminopimelate aminotransferase [Nitrospira sp. SB0675_bin_23]MYJ23409.1 LL-diaminopimelate aminotransferase [Nitrospira sp. SB0673_bin_12]
MSGVPITYAERIRTLPPYLFAAIDEMKQQAIARGVDIINLGIGDPDLPTPDPILERMQQAVTDPQHHQYPSSSGMLSFRTAVAGWYQRRFNVTVDPKSEVVTLIGSKEGIGHVPMAFIDPGDVVLVPSPGYPVYPVSASFAGGIAHEMPLLKQNGFLPDLDAIPPDVARNAKLMFLNSPNNPTSVIADAAFFSHVIAFAKEHHVIVCHDAAYSEIFYDGLRPSSFLEAEGAMDVGIEFHSLSKTFNMTGWRIGFAVGRAEVIAGLSQIKSNLDSGQFQAVQEAGITALESDDRLTAGLRTIYQERRDVLVAGLRNLGLEFETPSATFYVWIEVPQGYTSASFTAHLLEKAGIVTTPGNGFGAPGEGYIRMALTTTKERLAEAVDRLKQTGW